MSESNDIIHPIFMEYATLTTNDFWRYIFTQAAKGIFPACYYYRNNILYYRRKSKITVEQPSKSNLQKLCNFFSCTSGLGMDKNTNNSSNNSSNISSNNDSVELTDKNTWKNLKRKEKLALIIDYANRICSNVVERDSLMTLLTLCLDNNLITNNSFCMENGILIDIKGIIRGPDGFQLKIKKNKGYPTIEQILNTTRSFSSCPSFYKLWLEYLSNITGINIKSQYLPKSSSLSESTTMESST